MKAVILCAGYATRLHPLTLDRPKPLLPIGGRTMLAWILDRMAEIEEIEAVYLVANHRFARHFENWRREHEFPRPVEVVDDQTDTNETRLGAIGDLNFVLKEKNIRQDDLLVVAGDNFFDFDLKRFVRFGESKRPAAAIAVYDVNDRELAKHYGLVSMGPGGQVQAFYEKPADPVTTLASCGIYWIPREAIVLLDRYLSSGHNSDQPGHFMKWLAENHRLFALPLEGRWLDIGDRDSYEKANVSFQQFLRGNPNSKGEKS